MQKLSKMSVGLILLLTAPILYNESLADLDSNFDKPNSSGFWVLTGPFPINIIDSWEPHATNYGWIQGSGTEIDPYLIENVTFHGDLGYTALNLYNLLDDFFIIRNCTFEYFGASYIALDLNNVRNGEVTNCTFQHNGNSGLYLNNASAHVYGNNFYNNSRGINIYENNYSVIVENNHFYDSLIDVLTLFNANNSIVQHNYLENCPFKGIKLDDTQNATLWNNTLVNTSIGISIEGQNDFANITENSFSNMVQGFRYGMYTYSSNTNGLDNSLVASNTFNTMSTGIYLLYSENNTFFNNTLQDITNNGFYLTSDNNNNILLNNTFDNLNGGYYLGSSTNNTKIDGGVIYDTAKGICVFGENTTIQNVNITDATNGIEFQIGATGTKSVQSCSINNIATYGVYVNSIENVVVNGSVFYNNQYGISTNRISNITNNLFNYSRFAVNLNGADNCMVENNTIDDQINFGGSDSLVYAVGAENTTIRNNRISAAVGYGLGLATCINSIVEGNLFFDNAQRALFLSGSDNTTVFRNSFYEHPSSRLYFTSDTNTHLNNSEMGNYWWGYSGDDLDQDGIFDNPYYVESVAFDYLPINTPLLTQFVPLPENRSAEIGNVTDGFEWIIRDDLLISAPPKLFPQEYSITRNQSILEVGEWLPQSPIPIQFGSLAIGEWNYTIEISDGFGNNISQTVNITIHNTVPTDQLTKNFAGTIVEIGSLGMLLNYSFTDPSRIGALYNITLNGTAIIEGEPFLSNWCNLSLDGWALGFYDLVFEMTDGYGESESESISIEIRNTLPIISHVSSIANLTFEVGSAQIINFTIIDPSFCNPTYNYSVNGTLNLTNQVYYESGIISMDLSTYSVGFYTLELSVADGFGGVKQYSIEVNITTPETSDSGDNNDGDGTDNNNDDPTGNVFDWTEIFIIISIPLVAISIAVLQKKKLKKGDQETGQPNKSPSNEET